MPRSRHDEIEEEGAARRFRDWDGFIFRRHGGYGGALRRRRRLDDRVGDRALREQNLPHGIRAVINVGSVGNAGGEGDPEDTPEDAREDRAMNES